jgi:hypothetical protein
VASAKRNAEHAEKDRSGFANFANFALDALIWNAELAEHAEKKCLSAIFALPAFRMNTEFDEKMNAEFAEDAEKSCLSAIFAPSAFRFVPVT